MVGWWCLILRFQRERKYLIMNKRHSLTIKSRERASFTNSLVSFIIIIAAGSEDNDNVERIVMPEVRPK
jgi:hypothetical protein